MSLLESIGSGLEELGKHVQCFLLFSAGTVPEIGLLGEEGNRTRKQRMRNKRPWPSHVFTSFARSSINTLVSQALDLEKSKQKTLTGEKKIPITTRRQKTCSTLGNLSSTERNCFPPLELFHTLPLSLGIAEPSKYAPAVPQRPPPKALPTPHHYGHIACTDNALCRAGDHCGTAGCGASIHPSM